MGQLIIHTTISKTYAVPLTREDAAGIMSMLSDYAWTEIKADAQTEIASAIDASRESWMIVVNDIPVLALGVFAGTLVSNEGAIWLVMFRDAGIAVSRRLRALLALLLEKYTILKGFVEPANVKTVRLVEWLGGQLVGDDVMINDRVYRLFTIGGG